jgi:hypothetical protein
MAACETAGSLFALAHVELPDAEKASAALAQWKSIMLANMRAPADEKTRPYSVKNRQSRLQATGILTQGQQEDGQTIEAQAIWFVRGPHLYHAVVYADKLNREAVDNFLSGIELL